MRKTAQALPLRSDSIGKNFADENPDDRALGKREKRNIANEQPHQQILVTVSEKDGGDAGETQRSAYRADQQQSLAADPINDGHREHGEKQVRSTDGHGLKIGRDFIESGVGENVVQVVEDG